MKNKRAIAVIILLTISILTITYVASFSLNAFNEKFYKKEFKKYNIYENFPNKDIDQVNAEILLYLQDKKEDYNKELFNQNEIQHLKDVKLLIQKIDIFHYFIIIFSLLLTMILFLLDKKTFLKNISITLFSGGLLTLIITTLLLVFIIFNFNGIFTLFHHIFFPQGGWLFSSTDNIIKLYPSQLFYDIAKNIFLTIILFGNILIGAGILLFFYKND